MKSKMFTNLTALWCGVLCYLTCVDYIKRVFMNQLVRKWFYKERLTVLIIML